MAIGKLPRVSWDTAPEPQKLSMENCVPSTYETVYPAAIHSSTLLAAGTACSAKAPKFSRTVLAKSCGNMTGWTSKWTSGYPLHGEKHESSWLHSFAMNQMSEYDHNPV